MYDLVISDRENIVLEHYDNKLFDFVSDKSVNGNEVTLSFKNFELLDSFMAYLDEMEATQGMNDEQEELTPDGKLMQYVYDKALLI
ncbi:hypothetical protein GKC32_00670 [Lactobacillus curvatus]|nr:hypothetical protein [Latilactobacillus curvatus]MSE22988.1 hypothetical protein [Latilactobacillus curvatus]